MKKDRLILNEDRELFLMVSLSIFPIIPIILYIFSLVVWFLLIAITWVAIFVIIYMYFYSRLIVFEDKITIKSFNRNYEILFDDIAYILVKKNTNYINHITYIVELKEKIIPKRYLVIKNKTFQKMIENKTINLPIRSTIIF